MDALGDIQVIELLHLAFLQVLQARLDHSHYVVKGGTSLRYFYESARYSEGIDLDAIAIESWKLEERVDGALSSDAMNALLRTSGLKIGQITKPKQTETTQRWKVMVDLPRRNSVRTKIEFSHRKADSRRILEAVPDRVVAPYALRAPTLLHYLPDAATEQKIGALAERSETQARDVFDLDLLFRRHRGAVEKGGVRPQLVEIALERVFELPFTAYRDQVVAFLDPGSIELYDSPLVWKQMQDLVAERLMELT
jgi:predicted nucleotidyltransferase component of viral defense system